MGANKLLKSVQAGMQVVPAPVRRVMKSKPAMLTCVVLGGALTAYGQGEVTGSQAIAGVAIGISLVGLQSIPLGKVFQVVVSLGKKKP